MSAMVECRGVTRVRGLWGVAACAWALCAWSNESLPAGVRACSAEADALKRLACFDREVGRYAGPAATALQPPALVAVPTPEPPSVARAPSAANDLRHVAARVVSVSGAEGRMVMHLDNGQTWQQIQEATADMNLRAGDAITIDKSQGSFWLGARSSGIMKVELKP